VQFQNNGAIDHDFTVEGARFSLPGRPGKLSEKTLKLDQPGTYVYYCSIPGHREAGMQGKLVVGDGKGGTAVATTSGTKTGTSGDMASMATMPGMSGMAGMAADQHVSHATTAPAEQHGLQELQPAIEGDTKVFTLTAQVVPWEVIPGVTQEAWTYNGQLPGPVIHVTEGDKLRVTLKNTLPEPTIVHFHGPDLPNSVDGVPDVTQPVIPVGGSYSYEFTATPAGTYTYHSHHNSQVQETKGLYGILIIDPKPGTAEAKRDAQYQRDYLQVISEFNGYYLVNGHSFPATDVLTAKVGEKVRLRLVNLGQMAHPMHLHGFHFKIVGTDGFPVEGPPLVKDTVLIGPGERYDLEVVPDKAGLWVFHCHILSHVQNDGVEPGGMLTVLKVEA
jgi:FtsP/CotA-like multicopper oxidase with cupredoxin domain